MSWTHKILSSPARPESGSRGCGAASALPGSRAPYALLIVWLALLAFPLLSPNAYITGLGVNFLLNLMLLAGLNLVMGYCGQISLCQAGFYGLGAYVSGVFSTRYGTPPLVDALAAIVLTSFAAVIIGIPTFRLKGHYLAMATLGLNAILSVAFVELVGLTGGPNGLVGIPPFSLAGFTFDTDLRFYFLCWGVTLGVMWLLYNLVHSRIGRAMIGLAGTETGAQSSGINTHAVKLAVFAICAGLAAGAGSLYGHYTGYVSPESFSSSVSILLMVMIALGGRGRFFGPVLGALIYTVLPEALRAVPDAQLLVFGVLMIIVLTCFPAGVAGLGDVLMRRLRARPGKGGRHG